VVIAPHKLSDVLVAKVRFGELAIQNALDENKHRLFPDLAGHWNVGLLVAMGSLLAPACMPGWLGRPPRPWPTPQLLACQLGLGKLPISAPQRPRRLPYTCCVRPRPPPAMPCLACVPAQCRRRQLCCPYAGAP
jgi:hypothetical protein